MTKTIVKQIKKEVPLRSVTVKKENKQSFLIASYSRTSHTKHIGKDIATHTDGIYIGIKDHEPRRGVLGWLKAGRDGMKKNLTSISFSPFSVDRYNALILGSPIWAGKISPAIRTFVKQLPYVKEKLVGIFITHSGKNTYDDALSELELLLTRKGYKVIVKESFCMHTKPLLIRRKIQSFCARMMKD